jgi:hypothetical protein
VKELRGPEQVCTEQELGTVGPLGWDGSGLVGGLRLRLRLGLVSGVGVGGVEGIGGGCGWVGRLHV